MRIASVSTEYPAPWSPHRGLFIRRRTCALSRLADVTVIHSIPWFPVLRPWAGRSSRPVGHEDYSLVLHRRMFYLPGVLKGLDSRWVKRVVLETIREIEGDNPFDLIDAHF